LFKEKKYCESKVSFKLNGIKWHLFGGLISRFGGQNITFCHLLRRIIFSFTKIIFLSENSSFAA